MRNRSAKLFLRARNLFIYRNFEKATVENKSDTTRILRIRFECHHSAGISNQVCRNNREESLVSTHVKERRTWSQELRQSPLSIILVEPQDIPRVLLIAEVPASPIPQKDAQRRPTTDKFIWLPGEFLWDWVTVSLFGKPMYHV